MYELTDSQKGIYITLGHEKGVEEGRQEGRQEEQKKIIAKLFEKGMSLEEISSFLEISLDEVKSLTSRI